jgi:eukaryotic-like serine/threonine-protein kinase
MMQPLTRGSSLKSSAAGSPVAGAVEEFAAAWRRGDRPTAESFLARHPRLAVHPEAAIRVIYEEICLRRSNGHDVHLSELVKRFPRWQAELEVLLDCDRIGGAAADPPPPPFPTAGETLGEFVLLAELGRGARGRCFLAAQQSLSHRQVVLKVTPDDLVEHLSLARLQHTHIMPLYSEHEFPVQTLRALCMPYLGGETLARILTELNGVPVGRRTGQSLLDVLDRPQQPRPWPQSGDSPARRFVGESTYVRAVCWIGACLADALQYAHERGLVHMDVKPSNVLLTADSQPMLLDFHLARSSIPTGELPVDGVGGTPGYMSPEQQLMVTAINSGKAIAAGVDARSDLYSLGRVLAEMFGAQPGRAASADPASWWRGVPEVSTGLADVIGKCLATDPDDRYPTAAALADDLRRHMADLPLRGVANRSFRERWLKWCRRQPYEFFRVKTMLVACCAVATLAAVVWMAFLSPRFHAAEGALLEGKILLERRDYREAARALTRGNALIEGIPGGERLSRHLTEGLRRADRVEQADRLHRLVDRLRFAESAASRPEPAAKELEQHCRALWKSRHSLIDRSAEPLDPDLASRLQDDLIDLAVIGANLRVSLESEVKKTDEARRAALEVLDEAEALFGATHVLYRARQMHATALGLSTISQVAAQKASQVPPRTAWEHDAVGRIYLAHGNLAGAEAAFERALALEPQSLWPNFHQGVCAFRLGRYQDAVSAFRVCIALAPNQAECYYNRALAFTALNHTTEASRDYARAFSLAPTIFSRESRASRSVNHRGR